MITKSHAVMSLRPGVQWTMENDDVATIQWHADKVAPLTEAEVEAEMQRLAAEQEANEAARQSARRKIGEASGLTPEEMAALGL